MDMLFAGRLVLAALLYAFLAAVFVVLWRDMRAVPASAPGAQRVGRLIVLAGNQDMAPGAVLSLQPFTTLGRGRANTIVLSDTYASAEHAIIALRGGQWWLEDRGSRNGTLLNGARVDSPVVLGTGDVIGIGQVQLKCEL